MAEHEGVSVIDADTVSAVTASEQGAGETETLDGCAVCEVTEGNGSCHGDDIMVEILGSHVYVDGVCTGDGGDGKVEENPNDEGKNLDDGGSVEPRVDTGADYDSGSGVKLVEENEDRGEKVVNGGKRDVIDDSMNEEVENGEAHLDDDDNAKEGSMTVHEECGEGAIGKDVKERGNGDEDMVRETNTETSDVDGLVVAEAMVEQPQVVDEEPHMGIGEKDSCVEDYRSSEVILSSSDRNQATSAEPGSQEAIFKSAVNTSLTEQVHDANGKKDSDESMEVDGVEGDGDESADPNSSCQETKEVVAEATGTNGKELLGPEKEQEQNTEKPLEPDVVYEVDLKPKQDVEFDKSEAKQQEKKPEVTRKHANDIVFVDSTNSDQSTHKTGRGEVVEAMEYNVLLDPNFDVSNYIDFDGMLSCPGNVQQFKEEESGAGTELDAPFISKAEEAAAMDNQEGLKPHTKIKLPAESDTVNKMEIDEHSTNSKLVSLNGEHRSQVKERLDQTHVINEKGRLEKDTNAYEEVAGSSENSEKVGQARYELPLEEESSFSVSDLVWGKVGSNRWWPGQIFDPSDASEKALKYHKKDCFLVAYFGDGTFAWNDVALLKPFTTSFSKKQKQSSLEAFNYAVNCALEEVSRRAQLGLACFCMPEDAYEKIKFQNVENSGIRQESSKKSLSDKSLSTKSFKPDKLLEYIRALARSPIDNVDWLELVVAKAQLLAFSRVEDMFLDVSVEQNCSDKETSETQRGSYNRRKNSLNDGIYGSKKLRSLSELMGYTWDCFDGGTNSDERDGHKKRKVVGSFEDDSPYGGRKTISFAKVTLTPAQHPIPSFKIGECIRRAASQIAGSLSILKNGSIEESSSVVDWLAELVSAAEDPFQEHKLSNTVISFFSEFRDSVISVQHVADTATVKRKRLSDSIIGSPGTFEFDEGMKDTYWTDREIENGGGEGQQPSGGEGGHRIVPVEWKPVRKTRRPYRRRFSENNNLENISIKPTEYVDENASAELILSFRETDVLPSGMKLSKMFRHFGPIRESQTEVDAESSRARVVFKKCSDARVACNSAGKFNIFGPAVVSYQLNYTVSEHFKIPPMESSRGEEDA